jgi:hypothetical protein
VHRVYLEEMSGQSRRKLYAHRVEASQEIGTRMVNDVQGREPALTVRVVHAACSAESDGTCDFCYTFTEG